MSWFLKKPFYTHTHEHTCVCVSIKLCVRIWKKDLSFAIKQNYRSVKFREGIEIKVNAKKERTTHINLRKLKINFYCKLGSKGNPLQSSMLLDGMTS